MDDLDDPIDLRARAQSKAAADDEVRRARQVEIDDIRWLMKQKQGRRIMWRLLEKAGVFRLSYTSARSATDFNEGMRNMGLIFLADIREHCMGTLVTMEEEHEQYVRSADRRHDS